MNPAIRIRKQKIKLRHEIRAGLSSISRRRLRDQSGVIASRLLKLRAYHEATNIMVYWPLKDEPNLISLIRKSLADGKKVYLPRMKSGSRVLMEAYRIEKVPGELVAGPFGTLQPRGWRSRRISPSALSLIIVPGVSFDSEGGRLGRGLGCYDRFLKKADRAVFIGVGFKEQKIPCVPRNSKDIRMHYVVTA